MLRSFSAAVIALQVDLVVVARDQAERLRLEVAADYLVMAAWLAYLKSRLVLPQPGSPDMVFTANAGLVKAKRFVVSRFRYPERQYEEPYFTDWFMDRGYDVSLMPRDVPFEGAAVVRQGLLVLTLVEVVPEGSEMHPTRVVGIEFHRAAHNRGAALELAGVHNLQP